MKKWDACPNRMHLESRGKRKWAKEAASGAGSQHEAQNLQGQACGKEGAVESAIRSARGEKANVKLSTPTTPRKEPHLAQLMSATWAHRPSITGLWVFQRRWNSCFSYTISQRGSHLNQVCRSNPTHGPAVHKC